MRMATKSINLISKKTFARAALLLYISLPLFCTTTIQTFSIDKGDGSENVTFKMNWRFFQLCRVYFNSLKIANVGQFPWS